MGRLLMRLVALAVVGIAVYRGLQMAGVLGGEDTVEFEWADDAK
jgi:hypothetical protein